MDPEILKRGGALCRPPWLADKEILSFRWPEKAKTTLETKVFWRNISFSIFKVSPSLHIMKAFRRNLLSFSRFSYAFIRKENILTQHSMSKVKLRKLGLCFI